MTERGGTLRAGLFGPDPQTRERMRDALESRIGETEAVAHRLASGGTLTHERSGETVEKGGGDGGTLLAATDRKLVFVVDTPSGIETADVPYTDLKDATADSGLIRTTFSVTVWGRGTFSLDPDDGDSPGDVAAYATTAARAWQRVVAALQDARQQASTIPTHVEDGDLTAARDAHESARNHLRTARERIEDADPSFRPPLSERFDQTDSEVSRTWMEALYDRGQALVYRGTTRTGTEEYDAAHAAFRRAREHFETALAIAVEEGFDRIEDVQAAIADLEEKVATLEARPLEVAERARERAQAATSPEAAVPAWQRALDQYRSALVAGWGTDADFDGDPGALRMQIEWVAATLIDKRLDLAERLDAEADGHRETGEPERARDCREAATEQLAAAHRLASQYRACDADALAARLRERA